MKLPVPYKIVVAVCLTAAAAFADQTVMVPGGFAFAEAGSSDNAPLGASGQHFQQVFSSALLTNLSIGDLITGIGFRVEGNESALPAQTISQYNISLSRSANAPGNLSATFAGNRGADFLNVRSGPLIVKPGDFPGGNSPNNFGWIPFSTPYQFKGGNLLIEIAYQGFSAVRDADAAYPYDLSLAQTAFGSGYNSTTADAGLYNEALVMGFSITSNFTPLPEPAPAALFAIGSLLVIFRVRRRN